jgi:hypothetical protein
LASFRLFHGAECEKTYSLISHFPTAVYCLGGSGCKIPWDYLDPSQILLKMHYKGVFVLKHANSYSHLNCASRHHVVLPRTWGRCLFSRHVPFVRRRFLFLASGETFQKKVYIRRTNVRFWCNSSRKCICFLVSSCSGFCRLEGR